MTINNDNKLFEDSNDEHSSEREERVYSLPQDSHLCSTQRLCHQNGTLILLAQKLLFVSQIKSLLT